MENEQIMTELINQAATMNKGMARMRARYVFSDDPTPLEEKFLADAKEWEQWRKLGVQ